MQVDVLGPVRVRRGSDVLDLGAPRPRAVVAALALHAGRDVPIERLVDLVWGERPPAGVTTTLQAYVSNLRQVLEPARPRGTPGSVLVTVPGGYRLDLEPDAAGFERTVLDVRRVVGPISGLVQAAGRAVPSTDDLVAATEQLDAALGGWRGEPYADLGDAEDARVERTRLAGLRLLALEDRAVLDLWLGEDAAAAARLEPLAAANPWHERLWGLRALALARLGRQADALAVLAQLRDALDEQLGIDPSPELRDLQTAVLRQDPALRWRAERPAPEAGVDAAPRERSPLVGRDRELDLLLAALSDAEAGLAGFVGVVGEAGIGKSRLTRELGRRARQRGAVVLTGRCSQDEGAPSLWPWRAVLRGMDSELPGDAGAGGDFAVWEELVERVVAAAADRPVVVVLDDLHWADPATLRVLRLLVEHPDPGRLLVVLTWRPVPPPTGALGDVVEALGRRHAGRLTLHGLDDEQTLALVDAVVGARPDQDQAGELRRRTDGNPFFLLEYAQLVGEAGIDVLLTEPNPPTVVQEVLGRRLDRLPPESLGLVRSAAVGGRRVELDALAAVAGTTVDDVLDVLEPAVALGLVAEDGVDHIGFVHALVRDTAYLGLGLARRARAHAVWAEVLERRGGRETEVARHWAATGSANAARAWRAAVSAAAVVGRLHDHEQAATLLDGALALLDEDPQATGQDRLTVLLDLVEACRWAARWPRLLDAVAEAIGVARQLDDVEGLARAAVGTTQGTVWQSNAYGQVNEVVVGALRESLTRLPATDSALRARVMLALAVETYYGTSPAERDALAAEALTMAVRLGDPALQLEAHLSGIAAIWRPATAERRLAQAAEARLLAARLGADEVGVLTATLFVTTTAELGRLDGLEVAVDQVAREAGRLRLPYAQIALEELMVGLESMAGNVEAAQARIARMTGLHRRIGVQQTSDAVAGARAGLFQWQGRWAELALELEALGRSPLPNTAATASLLLRAGRRDDALALLAASPIDVEADDWLSLHTWCYAAEVARALDDRGLAAAVYARLAPFAGHLCMAGSSPTAGPVDAALALSASTVGEGAVATRHADDALVLLDRWGLTLAAERFRGDRVAYGF